MKLLRNLPLNIVLSKDSFFADHSDNDNCNESENEQTDMEYEDNNKSFSLFGFMNNKKSKGSPNKDRLTRDSSRNIGDQNTSSGKFFDSNSMSNNVDHQSDIDDNIVNVPAFFRKKNK